MKQRHKIELGHAGMAAASHSPTRERLSRGLYWLAYALAKKRTIDEFTVAVVADTACADRSFARVALALDAIEQALPGKLARMRTSFTRIVITPAGGAAGSYWEFLNACIISEDHLLTDSTNSVAMTLAHEAMHAHVARRGIQYRPCFRARIEQLCLSAEINLGRHLPGAERLVLEARAAMSTPWWTPEQAAARRKAHLRELRR